MTLTIHRYWALLHIKNHKLKLYNRISQPMPYTEEETVAETHCSSCMYEKEKVSYVCV